MYVLGSVGDDINEYTLSTPYDISSGTFSQIALSVAGQESTPTDMIFNNDGTRLYILGSGDIGINEYSLVALPASSDGHTSYISSTCKPSARFIKSGEEVSFDINIQNTEESYTFKWTNVLEGNNENKKHTFNEVGKFYPRAIVKNTMSDSAIVNCGTIVVEENDVEDNDSTQEDEAEEETQKQKSFSISNLPVRDLEIGMEGEDVKQLQILLNSLGYNLTISGPGSSGNETTIFGNLTKNALSKYQLNNNITPSVGYFGPKTREQMKIAGVEGWW